MRLLNVPHYLQQTVEDCQAACAAMAMDYLDGVYDDAVAQRLPGLLSDFAFGFRPASGVIPPAVTGLVAASIAGKGYVVDFYTTNPDVAGTQGLQFLKSPPWSYSNADIGAYAAHAAAEFAKARGGNLTVHAQGIADAELVAAISSGSPVVMLVDDGFLKGLSNPVNHVYVVTGIDAHVVRVQNPEPGTPSHQSFDRSRFLDAHRRSGTDCDAFVLGAK